MENKCYDSPSTNQKYMDHLYCHPNETNKNFAWQNNNNSSNKQNKKNNLHDKTNSRSNGFNNNNINNSYELLTKENKQLKSMLILNLDLIQQQAEKLNIKECELATRNDESTALRLCIEQLETQVAELQKQVQKQIKCAVMERTSVPPPPLAKIKCVHDNSKGASIQTTAKAISVTTPTNNIKPFGKATLASVLLSTNLPAPNMLKNDGNLIFGDKNKNTINDLKVQNINSTVKDRVTNLEENSKYNINDTKRKLINNKMVKNQQILNSTENKDKCENLNSATETHNNNNDKSSNSNKGLNKSEENKIGSPKACKSTNQNIIKNETDEIKILKELNEDQKPLVLNLTQQEHKYNSSINYNAFSTSISSVPSSPCSSPARIPNNHKKKRRLWYTPTSHMADDDDESLECFEYTSDIETGSRSTPSFTPSNLFEKLDNIGSSENSTDCGHKSDSKSSTASSMQSCMSCLNSFSSNIRLNSEGLIYCIANSPYHSRTWLEEELDGELEEDEARALRSLEPKLEIPKWTEHEIIPCYSIEGTEDLSDDMFYKRHAKQEMDEKRRKKWDVQQIREQRRIEKLRRRHCKDELIQGPVIQSFFPLPEDLETICYMDSLPLQAFGESIPKLPNSGEGFALPWLIDTESTTRPMDPPKQLFNKFSKYGMKRAARTEKVTQMSSNFSDHTYEYGKEKCFKTENLDENSLEDDQADLGSLSVEVDLGEDKEQSQTLKANICSEEDSTEKSKKEVVCTTGITTRTRSKEKDVESNETTTLLPYISKSCYSTPMVMLAQHTRSCSSRTQMRKRLKYSSYIFITKRKRQQSMSAFVETANKLTLNAANAKINTIMKSSNNNLSGTQETINGTQIDTKTLETTEADQNNIQTTKMITVDVTTEKDDEAVYSQKDQ